MKYTKVKPQGLVVIESRIFEDDRGFFFESWQEKSFVENVTNTRFVQDNISFSKKGTIRGLHYQVGDNPQGKLCQVLTGEVLDVAVDIRFGSPTFGEIFAIKLSADNKKQFWLPPGFAHGFSVLSEEALFMYKCTGYYSKKDERAITFTDKTLNIDWLVENPVLSEKDRLAPKFEQIERDFIFGSNC